MIQPVLLVRFALCLAASTSTSTSTSPVAPPSAIALACEERVAHSDAGVRGETPPAGLTAPGVLDPFHVPPAIAAQHNADGKILYRQGRWEDARDRYRAALAADPEFLAPALNIACSFVRQDRHSEALAEVVRLLDAAYLPWSEEVLSAADLGALKVGREGKQLRSALEAARLRWASGLSSDVVVVARTRAPLKLAAAVTAAATPATPRTLVLGQRQEVFAWSPRTSRYRQLTSEEGRVLALARSADGRRIAYLTAEKLIRGINGEGAASASALRGVGVRELDLTTLTSLGRATIDGDVARVDIVNVGRGFAYRIQRPHPMGSVSFTLAGERLEPNHLPAGVPAEVSLTSEGVTFEHAAGPTRGGRRPLPPGSGCSGTVADLRVPGRPPVVRVTGGGRHPAAFEIGGPHGASLDGLPIP